MTNHAGGELGFTDGIGADIDMRRPGLKAIDGTDSDDAVPAEPLPAV